MVKPFRRPWLWLGLWGLMLAAVVVLSLVPPAPLPMPRHGDKVEHLLAYAALSAGLVQLLVRRWPLLAAGIGLMLLGALLEWAQGRLTVTRLADPADALANALGVVLGLLTVLTRWRDGLLRLERRTGRRSME